MRKSKRDRRALVALALAVALAVPAFAAAEPRARPRTITVVGVGRERGTPDRAELRFAVEHTEPTARAASQAAAKSAERVVEALRKEVGNEGRIQTAGFRVNPVYRPPPERGTGGPQITGYTAQNEVSVETRRVDGVGALIDAAIAAGAARVNDLSFTIADPGPVQAGALRAAGADAAAQAAAIAAALNVRVKEVLEATTDASMPPVPRRYDGVMRAEAAMAQTPIEPGEVTAEVRLRVTYGVE
jgi:uncharacterized protein YggE